MKDMSQHKMMCRLLVISRSVRITVAQIAVALRLEHVWAEKAIKSALNRRALYTTLYPAWRDEDSGVCVSADLRLGCY